MILRNNWIDQNGQTRFSGEYTAHNPENLLGWKLSEPLHWLSQRQIDQRIARELILGHNPMQPGVTLGMSGI